MLPTKPAVWTMLAALWVWSSAGRSQSPEPRWVSPPSELLPGIVHGTFHSSSMNRAVGFNIYLPPGYSDEERRYPVIYWLPGAAGDESRHVHLSSHLHRAIESNRLPPLIMVFVNGGQATMYSDSKDGSIRAETSERVLFRRRRLPYPRRPLSTGGQVRNDG